MRIPLTPGKTFKVLVVSVLVLTVLGTAVQLCKYILGHDFLFGLTPLFDLSTDSSIPTWYSSATLLISAILLAIISIGKKEEKDQLAVYWGVLAVIFLYLSIDEVGRIHENIGQMIKVKFTGEAHGFVHYPWVIYGAALVLVVAVGYINFLRRIPFKTMLLMVISGAVYVGGALGMEMINARYDDLHGSQNLTYQMMTVFEEFLEMSGIAIFIYTLMSYIATQSSHLRAATIQIEKEGAEAQLPGITDRKVEPELPQVEVPAVNDSEPAKVKKAGSAR